MTRPKHKAVPAKDTDVVPDAATTHDIPAGVQPALQPAAIEAKRKEIQTQLLAVERQVSCTTVVEHAMNPTLVDFILSTGVYQSQSSNSA